ncbi:MAG: hypothetical protein AABX88_01850 [Nanoarchaeota archaeon]
MIDYNLLSVQEVYDLIKEKTNCVEESVDKFRKRIIDLYPACSLKLYDSSAVFRMKPASGLHRYLQLKIDNNEISELNAKDIMLKSIWGVDYEGFTRFNSSKLEEKIK